MTEEPKSLKPVLPLKIKLSLSMLVTVTDFSRRSDGTINRRLVNFLDHKAKVPPQPIKGVKTSDITVDPTRNLWFRLFEPLKQVSGTLPVLVFFHGGAFSFLSADSVPYDAVCRRFARRIPAVVVSVNYRLSPEHKCPAAYDDGFDTLRFLDERKYADFPENADLSRCFLAGDSAGGNLAHHVSRRAVESKFNSLKVIGLMAIQPFFGGKERTESEIRLKNAPLVSTIRTDWHWKAFLPDGADADHAMSNVFGPNSIDISGLDKFPSALVFVGGFDPLQDWQRRYYEGLKRSGKEARLIEYPNAIHAFYLFPEFPEAPLLIAEVVKFVNNNGKIN